MPKKPATINSVLGTVFLMVCAVSAVMSQSVGTGLPFISNFTPKEYNANTQNWAVVQDQRGVMYFGNNRGVLEYDGTHWRVIPLSNNSIVRSLNIDSEGTIYVGGVGEFGYLTPNEEGKMVYHSLIDQIKNKSERSFSDIWSTLVKDDEVYFQSFNVLFRYKNGQIKSWPLNYSYHRSFVVHDRLYLRQNSLGLTELKNDSLVKVPGGDIFTNEYISVMLPFDDQVLIGSRNEGLFLLNPEQETIQKFDAPINEFISKSRLYHGTVLPNGNFAFATLEEGLVIIDKKGRQVLYIDETKGLQYQIVYNLYSDNTGSLWLATANGISKVEILSPITVFDQISGLRGGVLSVIRFEGILYACTHEGIFFLNKNGLFEQINGVNNQCWQLLKFDIPSQPGKHKLLLAASDGVYEIKKNKATNIHSGRVGTITASPSDPHRLYVGLIGTVVSLRYENGQWIKEGETTLPQDEIRSMVKDNHGNLWLGTMYGGAYRIRIKDWEDHISNKTPLSSKSIKKYGVKEGIPVLNWNYFFNIGNELIVTTTKGLYKYNVQSDKFEKHKKISKAINNEERWIYYIKKDNKGNLWFDSDKGKGMFLKRGTDYVLYENPFKRIIVSPENQVTGYTDKNGILWFGTPDGLFRYDSKYKKDYNQPFKVLIRQVNINGDSTLFHGSYFKNTQTLTGIHKITSLTQPASLQPTLEYELNSLAFHYTATAYENKNGNQFSYYLEGYDQAWSAWSKETKKEYTNLPEGQYTFKVKGKNFYGTISDEMAYSFVILSPWYRSSWTYTAYIILSVAFMYMIAVVYSKRLKKDNQRLETMVKLRTTEINAQKEKIEKQKNEVEQSYKNVTTLSEIGQNITSTLDLKSIIDTLYKSINSLMDAPAFGVGIYNEQAQSLDFRYTYESDEILPPFSQKLSAKNKMAVWCFNNCKEIFINDLDEEYARYIPSITTKPTAGQRHCQSIIYIPLQIKNKMMGVITVQSFSKNAYRPFHLDILHTLAAYTAIALDNSYAYLRLNEINEELTSALENLKQTQSHLVQAEKMASLGQLTAGVAHEINNPINFVSAGIDSLAVNYEDLNTLLHKYASLGPDQDNSQLLREIEDLKKEVDLEYLLEEVPQLLKSIKSGATRTTEIVKSLKNFTRLDEDNLKKTDVNEGLDSTLVILRNQMSNRIEVVKEYDDLPPINCYPGQLNQVFMNIISNAIQAIDGSGKIYVKTSKQKGSVIIRIKDSGNGMSEELKQRIFEPFFTTKDVGQGTGLGLSISYSIIEKHQGHIEVKSAPGKGTEFIIQLPSNLN